MFANADLPAAFQNKLEEFVGLTPGEDGVHAMFSHLASATHIETMRLGAPITAYLARYHNADLVAADLKQTGADFSQTLLDSWYEFATLYPTIVKRNPRLELRDIMHSLSERHDFTSWPAEREWAIERWIADGAPLETEPYPVDPDLRARLLELHPKLGGWVYHDDRRGMVVFAQTAEFREEKVRLDAERQTRIREEKERIAISRQRHEALVRAAPPKSRLIAIGPVRPDVGAPE